MQLDTRYEQLKADIGNRYLDGDKSAARDMAEIRYELDAIEQALSVLDERQKATEIQVRRAEAAEKREQAASMRQQIDELLEQARKPLAELSRLMGVEYTPCIFSAQRIGKWPQSAAYTRPLDLLAPGQAAPDPTNMQSYATTRAQVLHDAAAKLEAEALAIEQTLETEAARAALATPKPAIVRIDRSVWPAMAVVHSNGKEFRRFLQPEDGEVA